MSQEVWRAENGHIRDGCRIRADHSGEPLSTTQVRVLRVLSSGKMFKVLDLARACCLRVFKSNPPWSFRLSLKDLVARGFVQAEDSGIGKGWAPTMLYRISPEGLTLLGDLEWDLQNRKRRKWGRRRKEN